MLCLACGAEMRLMQAIPDTTMMVTGYEHHTLQCTACNEIERRLVFVRQKTPVANVPMPTHPPEPPPHEPPPDEPPPHEPLQHEHLPHGPLPQVDRVAAPSVWARTVAKLRGRPMDPGS